jgi:hypothetical protein
MVFRSRSTVGLHPKVDEIIDQTIGGMTFYAREIMKVQATM